LIPTVLFVGEYQLPSGIFSTFAKGKSVPGTYCGLLYSTPQIAAVGNAKGWTCVAYAYFV
jgi:hypothetical protein